MRGNLYLFLLSSVIGLGACGGGVGGVGDFGATPGGLKDLRFARELIGKGQIPPPDALLVEAMFAEHDLGLTGEPCARTLCLRAGAGFAPEHDGTPRGWAQVGMSSTIDPATWQRPSTTFIYTVDVSGSMGWGGDVTPGGLSRMVLHRLANELRPDDRVAIVTYGSDVSTRLGLTSGSNLTKIHSAIDGLSENGSTNMEAGMKRAYSLGESAVGSTEQVRVIVFTDVQPNVGATDAGSFNGMVATAATKGVHTTVLGLGTGIGPEVLRAMASLRGANAYSLTKPEHVDDLMAEEYPWFTTPVAYGLRVNVALDGSWAIDRGLGFPAASDGEQIGLKAETVFLSRRKGALLVALASPDDTPSGLAGSFSLAYTEPDGTAITDAAAFSYDATPLDASGQWFAQHGTARTVALGLLTEAMHDAAVAYPESSARAAELMTTATVRFSADADVLGDDDLAVELELAQSMLTLIEQGAPQGTLYGQ